MLLHTFPHSMKFFMMGRIKVYRWALGLLLLGQINCLAQPADSLLLHVPSPVWEDQIIYFLMTDRFNDGNRENNDQGYEEYNPQSGDKYSGGDIQGVIDQLDYIQNLGATAVWTTPVMANQWWDGVLEVGGYHGYWPEHFKAVDQHLGTIVDFQKLSHHLHKRGMYLIQDIVVNHTGNYFRIDENAYQRDDPKAGHSFNGLAGPLEAPSQYPFNLIDAGNPDHQSAGIYHWTPPIWDYNDSTQLASYGLAPPPSSSIACRRRHRE